MRRRRRRWRRCGCCSGHPPGWRACWLWASVDEWVGTVGGRSGALRGCLASGCGVRFVTRREDGAVEASAKLRRRALTLWVRRARLVIPLYSYRTRSVVPRRSQSRRRDGRKTGVAAVTERTLRRPRNSVHILSSIGDIMSISSSNNRVVLLVDKGCTSADVHVRTHPVNDRNNQYIFRGYHVDMAK